MIICIGPREVRSSQAPLGIPTSEYVSSRGGALTWKPLALQTSAVSVVTASMNLPSPQTDGCLRLRSLLRSVGCMWGGCPVSWGSGSSPSDMASSIGVGEVTGSSSATSNMEASNRSSLSIRVLRHLWRSWTVSQSMLGELPIVQCTTGGPGPEPLSLLASPLRCP